MSTHTRTSPTRRLWIAALTAIATSAMVTTATALPGDTGHVAFSRDGDVWAADADGTDQVQLTSGPEDERWPRWSPEGNRIAVVQDGDLVLLRATGARLRRLTTHGDVVAAPSWSPDGRYLAYVRGSDGIAIVDATQADSNGTLHELGAVRSVAWNAQDGGQIAYTEGGAVFTVRSDGSEAGTEIVPPDPEGRTREELSWDPLTGQVVFTSEGTDGTRIEGAGILLGGGEGDDRSPAWSADGQEMFFTRGDMLHVYRHVPFPGSDNVRSLGVVGAAPDAQPSLVSSAAAYETSTGTQVSFRVRPLGTAPTIVAYQTVPAMGSATAGTDYVAESGEVTTPDAFGNAVVVPVFVFGDSEPEPDETFYVDFTFPSDPAAPLRVRGTILNDDGGRNGVITYTADQAVWALDPLRGAAGVIVASAGSAIYSPGGHRLAYLGSEAGQVQLVVADPSGAPQVTFPIAGAFDHEIVWSPDGARLAWTVGAALWVADPSNPASASAIATDAVTPSWSSDTGPGPRRLAFARVGTGMVCTVREDGSDESCLTAGFQPQWSPDNTTVAFLRGDVAVFLMNPDGTNERLAASATRTLEGARLLRWSPRGGSFAFTTGSALFVGQEGGPAASVPGLPASLWGFDWSPDGRQLVVQGTDSTGQSQLWIAGPDDAGVPSAAVRQATTGGGAAEPRWSTVPVRPTAGLASRGGIERFGQARVEVQLDAPSPDMVVLTWETVDTGSATPDVDFTSGTGTVALQPGETTGAIVVPVLDDTLAEGPESFDLRLTGAAGARIGSESRVNVFITDDDGVPVAVPDVAATALDTPVDIPVLDNDNDPDGDPLSLVAVDTPAHGSVTVAGGVVTYTPGPGFNAVDHFLYTISDGRGYSARGLVSVYVHFPPPAPPVLTVSPSFLDFGTVPLNKTKDLVVTVTNNTAEPVPLAEVFPLDQADPQPFDVSDFEGVEACRLPAARLLEPGQSCTQKVRFWSVPGAGAASPATVRFLEGATFETLATIALFASAAPPDTGPNLPPVAVDDLVGAAQGSHTLDAIRNDSDPDHDILHITTVSDPPHGTTAVVPCNAFTHNPNADCVRYVSDAGYTGTDAFTYAVSDGRGGEATATFHLAVGNVVPQVAAITPSSGHIAGGQAVRITGSGFVYRSLVDFVCPGGVFELVVSQLTDTEILATTPPAPGGVCTVRVRTLFGRHGQLVNGYRYNTAPLAQDGAVSTNEDAPTTITLTATDADGDPLAFAIVSGPGHGALSAVTGAQATYTPADDYNGPDSFTFRASDGLADSNVATISITVQAPATRVLSVTKTGSGGGDVTFTPPGIQAVAALAAGFSHACAIRYDGTVACWGGNSLGQATAPGGTFRSTTAGMVHTCGLQTDGAVVCWGDLTWGDPPSGPFASVSAGGGHTCGLRADGNLNCWGQNSTGEADEPPGLYRAVSAGRLHTCAVRSNGTLVCWGDNVHGQRAAPAGTFQSLAAGDQHTCAVRTDGTVACWGNNRNGQAAPPAGTFTSVSAGSDHSCGLRSDGAVVCWGDNLDGESTTPAGAFTAIAAGWNYTCATRSSGALACWGTNAHGQTLAPAGDFLAACPTCRVYPTGTEVTLVATPDPESVFDGWSGDCTGTGTCTVTMDQDRSVTATFMAATATPTTTTVTTSGSPSLPGQTVTFTATVAGAGGPGPTPAGQVHFQDTTAGTPLGTVPLDASGSATLETSALAVGTHTIQATYLPAAGQLYAGSNGTVVQTVDANVPPVAVDDGPFSVIEGDNLTVPPPGVLANDADTELAALTARLITAPAHGVLFLRPSGGFDYTPQPGYVGPDSFTYMANDGYADSNVATVSLTVHPRVVVIAVVETVHVTDTIAVDPAVMIDVAESIHVTDGATLKTSPRADAGTASTTEDTPVLVSLSATDADGDPFTLTIVSGPAHGTVFPPAGVVMPSGTLVTYTPAPDYVGADSFTFKATDSQGDSNLATVAIVVQPAPGHEVVTGVVPPGETLTTDTEGDGATSEDVIETTVLTPQGGEVIIDETPAPAPPPTAFTFLPHQVQITAPPGSASQPLLLTFLIDASEVSSFGGTLAMLAVFRNGFEVPPCRPGATATPDPCVWLRQLVDDDVRLVVRTSRASVWTFGVPRSTSGAVTGALRPLSGGTVAFAAARIHGQLVGALRYQKGSEQFLALRVSAFAVEDDGHTAWFAGLGVDGRAFLAYAEDGGADGDVFRLWIGGVDKTGDGSLASGRVVVAP